MEVNQNLYPDLYQMSVMDAGGTVIEYDRPEHKAFIGADPNRFPGFLYEYVKWRIRLTNENKQVGYGYREGRIDIWVRPDFFEHSGAGRQRYGIGRVEARVSSSA